MGRISHPSYVAFVFNEYIFGFWSKKFRAYNSKHLWVILKIMLMDLNINIKEDVVL